MKKQQKIFSCVKVDRVLPWLLGLAFVWGLSEATIFFIVPDVIISFIALKYGFRQGVFAAAASVGGAVLGGVLAFMWGKSDIVGARAFFDMLPAIAPSTIARAASEIAEPSFGLSMFMGSLSGVPFKLYASEAGAAGTSLLTFALLTPVVRLPRFLLAAVLAGLANRFLPRRFSAEKWKVLALFWIAFYVLFWTLAPS